MNTVKFYVGEMSSYLVNLGRGEEELHVLERLDCVLSADTRLAIDCLDESLRKANKSFIRSDNPVRTVVDFNAMFGDVKHTPNL